MHGPSFVGFGDSVGGGGIGVSAGGGISVAVGGSDGGVLVAAGGAGGGWPSSELESSAVSTINRVGVGAGVGVWIGKGMNSGERVSRRASSPVA